MRRSDVDLVRVLQVRRREQHRSRRRPAVGSGAERPVKRLQAREINRRERRTTTHQITNPNRRRRTRDRERRRRVVSKVDVARERPARDERTRRGRRRVDQRQVRARRTRGRALARHRVDSRDHGRDERRDERDSR